MIGFGGPAAHIALMQNEVVRRRGWLTDQEFLDLVGATNLIPGPNSTELAIHIGRRRAGAAGLVGAGVAFILPSAVLVTLIAWAYRRYGTLPQTAGLLYGVKPVVVTVVIQALIGLARSALKTPALVAVGIAALGRSVRGRARDCDPRRRRNRRRAHRVVAFREVALQAGFALAAAAWAGTGSVAAAAGGGSVASLGLWPLFLVFLKAGGLLFGSGYVLFAFLRADLVTRLHWTASTSPLSLLWRLLRPMWLAAP